MRGDSDFRIPKPEARNPNPEFRIQKSEVNIPGEVSTLPRPSQPVRPSSLAESGTPGYPLYSAYPFLSKFLVSLGLPGIPRIREYGIRNT